MNLASLFKKIVHAATPVVKAAAPVVITAIILHQPLKTAIVGALRDELNKTPS